MKKQIFLFFTATTTALLAQEQSILVYDPASAEAVHSHNSAESGTITKGVDLGLGSTRGSNDESRKLSFSNTTPYITASEIGYDFFGGFEGGFDTSEEVDPETGEILSFPGSIGIVHRGSGEIRTNMTPPGDQEGFLRGVIYTPASLPGTLDQQVFEYDTGYLGGSTYRFHAVAVSGTDTYVSVESYSNGDDTWSLAAANTNWVLWDFTDNDFMVTFSDAVAAPSVQVDAMGFYFLADNAKNFYTDAFVNVRQMRVSIPEPASAALLCASFMAAFGWFRRR